MAGTRVLLHAQQRPGVPGRQLVDDLAEVDPGEDLLGVAPAILGGEHDPGALAHPLARVLGVLHVPELGGRRQLGVMAVGDPGLRHRRLQPLRVGPGVLRPPHPSPLAHIEHQRYVSDRQRGQKALQIPVVDPDGDGALAHDTVQLRPTLYRERSPTITARSRSRQLTPARSPAASSQRS
jgi:hypothetical protein